MTEISTIGIIAYSLLGFGGVAAITYGLKGYREYGRQELWWCGLGAIVIFMSAWDMIARNMFFGYIETPTMHWIRQLFWVGAGAFWLWHSYKTGYFSQRK